MTRWRRLRHHLQCPEPGARRSHAQQQEAPPSLLQTGSIALLFSPARYDGMSKSCRKSEGCGARVVVTPLVLRLRGAGVQGGAVPAVAVVNLHPTLPAGPAQGRLAARGFSSATPPLSQPSHRSLRPNPTVCLSVPVMFQPT